MEKKAKIIIFLSSVKDLKGAGGFMNVAASYETKIKYLSHILLRIFTLSIKFFLSVSSRNIDGLI